MAVKTRRGAKSVAPASPVRASDAAAPSARDGAVLGRLVALGSNGEPWVSCGGDGGDRQQARTTVAIGPELVGRDVMICFAGLERTPVIVGIVLGPGAQPIATEAPPAIDLLVDRRRIVFSAREEVVLRCGKASIVLTADGKVVVRGADVVTTAAGTNRIRGGSVRIN